MNITFAASEGVPFSKTGGLADVVGALPRALAELGHNVTTFLPRYKQTRLAEGKIALRSVTIPFDDQYRFCSVMDGGKHAGVQFYFIDYPPFFERDALYGVPGGGDYPDNAERFAMFSRAVIEASKLLGVPDVFHCHDWQTALIPVLLHTNYVTDPSLKKCGVVFSIHNQGYQGLFESDVLPLLNLPWELFTMNRMEFYGKVNFLKGGIVFSDAITTVSKRYAQEIQTSEYGFGLEGVLRTRSGNLYGILNGVDYGEWDPATDHYIAKNYSLADVSGKTDCRANLLNGFGLAPLEGHVLIGIVSRFAQQKGFDLIASIADRLLHDPVQMVVLGTGDPQYEQLFLKLQQQYPTKFAVKVAYDNALAHKVEAGADIFLMPSRYEPSGLNQMYSLKYGTVPLVRATGGLDDSIEDWNPVTRQGTGFKFHAYHGEALYSALREALEAFKDRDGWRQLMLNGMKKDFSWSRSAREYVKVYERALQNKSSER
jgi:starch synthase